jgi:hypothetical protein
VDTTAESVVKTMAPDSLHPAVQGSFLHTGGELLEAPRTFLSGHAVIGPGQFWIFYILFGLIALFAIIKFYYSRDLKTLVSALGRNTSRQENESSTKAGFMVPMFLFVNFLVAMGLLLLAVNEKFHVINTENIPIFNFFLIAGLVVLGYYLFNEFTILFVGFLFGTSKQALLHAKTGSYLVYILGIILTPVLIIYFFTGLDFLLYLAGTSIVLAVLFKWTLLLRNSYSLNHYTPFHIILYLCGLEIIPIMLLIKVGMMYA